jgi:hypothetical protein
MAIHVMGVWPLERNEIHRLNQGCEMNVVLHGWPDDPKLKTYYQTRSHDFQYMVIVPVMAVNYSRTNCTAVTQQDLIFRFIYHDGSHYHYELTEQEFV